MPPRLPALLAGAGASPRPRAATEADGAAPWAARRGAAGRRPQLQAARRPRRSARPTRRTGRAPSEALAAARSRRPRPDLSAAERRIALDQPRSQAEQRLAAEQQAPVAACSPACRHGPPPAGADAGPPGSVEDMVQVRALLDATMPVIERRSARSAPNSRAQRRAAPPVRARPRGALAASRDELARAARRALPSFEANSATRSQQLAGLALGRNRRSRAGLASEAQALAGELEAPASCQRARSRPRSASCPARPRRARCSGDRRRRRPSRLQPAGRGHGCSTGVGEIPKAASTRAA